MNVLFVATRSPWPSVDGGRVLMAQTIAGLRARGHRVTVVAPTPVSADMTPDTPLGPDGAGDLRLRFVPVRRRGWAESIVRAGFSLCPPAIERHRQPAIAREVGRCLRAGVDVVHVQQLHAFANVGGVAGRGVPIVLRAENVETDLWRQAGARAWWGPAARWSTAALQRWERAALERATSTAAVSDRDAAALRRLAPHAAIDVVPIPMPAALPAGPRLGGEPAIVLMASAWRPNRDGASWFLGRIWPGVAAALPAARLHVFGLPAGARPGPGVEAHPRPDASIEAFPDGAIAVVPLRIASGANVRILEAWARGLPVVASPIAAGGVGGGGVAAGSVGAAGVAAGVASGAGVAVAAACTAAEFTAAFRRLTEPAARERAVAAGRAALVAHHDPAAMAAGLERVYEAAIHAAIHAAPGRGSR